jgi:hypothetical protein
MQPNLASYCFLKTGASPTPPFGRSLGGPVLLTRRCYALLYPSSDGSMCRPSSSSRIGLTQRTAVSGSVP